MSLEYIRRKHKVPAKRHRPVKVIDPVDGSEWRDGTIIAGNKTEIIVSVKIDGKRRYARRYHPMSELVKYFW